MASFSELARVKNKLARAERKQAELWLRTQHKKVDGELSAALNIPLSTNTNSRIEEHVPTLTLTALRGRAQSRFKSHKKARQVLTNSLPTNQRQIPTGDLQCSFAEHLSAVAAMSELAPFLRVSNKGEMLVDAPSCLDVLFEYPKEKKQKFHENSNNKAENYYRISDWLQHHPTPFPLRELATHLQNSDEQQTGLLPMVLVADILRQDFSCPLSSTDLVAELEIYTTDNNNQYMINYETMLDQFESTLVTAKQHETSDNLEAFERRIKFWAAESRMDERDLLVLFERHDTDSFGSLSKAQLRRAFLEIGAQQHTGDTANLFQKFCNDSNGFDYAAFVKSLQFAQRTGSSEWAISRLRALLTVRPWLRKAVLDILESRANLKGRVMPSDIKFALCQIPVADLSAEERAGIQASFTCDAFGKVDVAAVRVMLSDMSEPEHVLNQATDLREALVYAGVDQMAFAHALNQCRPATISAISNTLERLGWKVSRALRLQFCQVFEDSDVAVVDTQSMAQAVFAAKPQASTRTSAKNKQHMSRRDLRAVLRRELRLPHSRTGLFALFQQVDRDRSGIVSVTQLARVLDIVGLSFSTAELQQLLTYLDPRRSGLIDCEAFVSFALGENQNEEEYDEFSNEQKSSEGSSSFNGGSHEEKHKPRSSSLPNSTKDSHFNSDSVAKIIRKTLMHRPGGIMDAQIVLREHDPNKVGLMGYHDLRLVLAELDINIDPDLLLNYFCANSNTGDQRGKVKYISLFRDANTSPKTDRYFSRSRSPTRHATTANTPPTSARYFSTSHSPSRQSTPLTSARYLYTSPSKKHIPFTSPHFPHGSRSPTRHAATSTPPTSSRNSYSSRSPSGHTATSTPPASARYSYGSRSPTKHARTMPLSDLRRSSSRSPSRRHIRTSAERLGSWLDSNASESIGHRNNSGVRGRTRTSPAPVRAHSPSRFGTSLSPRRSLSSSFKRSVSPRRSRRNNGRRLEGKYIEENTEIASFMERVHQQVVHQGLTERRLIKAFRPFDENRNGYISVSAVCDVLDAIEVHTSRALVVRFLQLHGLISSLSSSRSQQRNKNDISVSYADLVKVLLKDNTDTPARKIIQNALMEEFGFGSVGRQRLQHFLDKTFGAYTYSVSVQELAGALHDRGLQCKPRELIDAFKEARCNGSFNGSISNGSIENSRFDAGIKREIHMDLNVFTSLVYGVSSSANAHMKSRNNNQDNEDIYLMHEEDSKPLAIESVSEQLQRILIRRQLSIQDLIQRIEIQCDKSQTGICSKSEFSESFTRLGLDIQPTHVAGLLTILHQHLLDQSAKSSINNSTLLFNNGYSVDENNEKGEITAIKDGLVPYLVLIRFLLSSESDVANDVLDAALRENEQLKASLGSIDVNFFNEVENVKHALEKATETNRQLEEHVWRVCEQTGVAPPPGVFQNQTATLQRPQTAPLFSSPQIERALKSELAKSLRRRSSSNGYSQSNGFLLGKFNFGANTSERNGERFENRDLMSSIEPGLRRDTCDTSALRNDINGSFSGGALGDRIKSLVNSARGSDKRRDVMRQLILLLCESDTTDTGLVSKAQLLSILLKSLCPQLYHSRKGKRNNIDNKEADVNALSQELADTFVAADERGMVRYRAMLDAVWGLVRVEQVDDEADWRDLPKTTSSSLEMDEEEDFFRAATTTGLIRGSKSAEYAIDHSDSGGSNDDTRDDDLSSCSAVAAQKLRSTVLTTVDSRTDFNELFEVFDTNKTEYVTHTEFSQVLGSVGVLVDQSSQLGEQFTVDVRDSSSQINTNCFSGRTTTAKVCYTSFLDWLFPHPSSSSGSNRKSRRAHTKKGRGQDRQSSTYEPHRSPQVRSTSPTHTRMSARDLLSTSPVPHASLGNQNHQRPMLSPSSWRQHDLQSNPSSDYGGAGRFRNRSVEHSEFEYNALYDNEGNDDGQLSSFGNLFSPHGVNRFRQEKSKDEDSPVKGVSDDRLSALSDKFRSAVLKQSLNGKNQKISSENSTADLLETLRKFDLNQDGLLSLYEFHEALCSLDVTENVKDSIALAHMIRANANEPQQEEQEQEEGSLTFDQFLNFLMQPTNITTSRNLFVVFDQVRHVLRKAMGTFTQGNLKRLFAQLDPDDSGHISRRTLAKFIDERCAFPLTENELDAVHDHMDDDRDGFVSFGDLLLFVKEGPSSPKKGRARYLEKLGVMEERVKDVVRALADQGDGTLDVKAAFSAFDENESGVVTTAEFAKALHGLGFNLSRTQLQILLRYLDSNNDGMIEYSEFLTFFAGTCHGQGIQELDSEAQRRQRIKSSNQRLEIGVRESLKRLQVGPSLRRQFRGFDRDGSGTLEYNELASMIRTLGFNTTEEQQDHLWKCMGGGDPHLGARITYAWFESFVDGISVNADADGKMPVSATERQRGVAVLRRLRRAADQRRIDISAPFRLRVCLANSLDSEEMDANGFHNRVRQLGEGINLTRLESNALFRGVINAEMQREVVTAKQVLQALIDREDLIKKWRSKSGLRGANEYDHKMALAKVLERALGQPAEGLATHDELVRTLRQLGFSPGGGGGDWQISAVAELCVVGVRAGFGSSSRVDWSIFVDFLYS